MTKEKDTQAAVGQDALEKALTTLSDLAKSEKDEKAELMQKSLTGTELSADENARLLTLLGGGQGTESTLAKSVTAPLNTPETTRGVDVSEYLGAFHTGNLAALETLSDSIEKSDSRQSEFNMVLAKALVQVGTLVKSQNALLEQVLNQSTEQPRGATTQRQAQGQAATPMTKSFGGQEGQGGEQINKSEILNLLEEMHVDSIKKGQGGSARCGEDLMKSIAKYEQTGKMTRALVDEMKSYRGTRSA